MVANLEHVEDYNAFEAAVISDFDPQTVVARELVLRLASLLWRLRRANAIESNLFEIQLKNCRSAGLPVAIVVGSLAGGMSFEEIQREYDLSAEDIRAAQIRR